MDKVFGPTEAQAFAVLATATKRTIGDDELVVSRLNQLARAFTPVAYQAAASAFDRLAPETRGRIDRSARQLAGEARKKKPARGLVGVLNRGRMRA